MNKLASALLLLNLLPAVAVADLRPGIDVDNHRFTITDNNGIPIPWYPIGYSPGLGAMIRRCDGVGLVQYYTAFHNWLSDRGIRSYRTVFTFGQPFAGSSACSSFTETLPYLRNGSGLNTAADGGEPFDLDQFNTGHFSYWEGLIQHAASKGIVVQLNIFDTWHLNKNEHIGLGWGAKYDFYEAQNNTSGADFDPREECTWYSTDTQSGIYQRQRALVREAVKQLGDRENLILEVANEPGWKNFCNGSVPPNARASVWVAAMQGEITAALQQYHPNVPHLMVPGNIPEHRDVVDDFEAEAAHDALVGGYALNKPLIAHNDCGSCLTSDPDEIRARGWAALTAGAHIDFFTNSERRSDFEGNVDAIAAADDLGHIGAFLDLNELGIVMRGMEPLESCTQVSQTPGCSVIPQVSTPKVGSWAFGSLGGHTPQYIVYKRGFSGNSWFILKNPPADYTARWFDPRAGVLVPLEAVGVPAIGGHRFTPPTDTTKDWVLHLVATPQLQVFVPDEPVHVFIPDGGSFSFSGWSLGSAPASQIFDICNSGGATMTLDSPTSLVSGSGFSQISPTPAATITPGNCTSLHVEFHVNAAGTYTGSVSIASNAAGASPHTFTLHATVGNPEIRVRTNPQGVNVADGGLYVFPTRSLSQLPISQLFDLCNDGTDPLTISNPNSLVAGFGFAQIGTAPATTVSPGACTAYRVRFHVAAAGTYTGSVSITNNDSDENPFNFTVRGTAVSVSEIRVRTNPQAANVVDGGLYTFPTRSLSQLPVSQLFDLCNDGTDPLTISNPTTLVNGIGFAQIGTAPATTVSPGTCSAYRVRFHVAAAGTYTGSVSITNNDSDENPFNFTVRGTAVSLAEISVRTNPQGVNVADGGLYTYPTRSLSQLPVSQLFDLCNDGADPLTISNPTSLVSGAGFSQIGASPASTVSPGTCTNLRVRFHVGVTGTYTGGVSIVSNDGDESPFNISLSATAVP